MNAPDIRLTDPSAVQPEIRRGRVSSLEIYEITKDELGTLEQGTPCGVFLNLAIFFWSTAAAFFTSLVTGNIQTTKVFTVFVVVIVVGIAAGVVLTLLWWRTRGLTNDLLKKIRQRIPDDKTA